MSFREGLIPADEARSIVLDAARVLEAETVPLKLAAGRVLASDLVALRTQPPFDASAMDGYAFRSTDVCETPFELELIGEAAAGHPYDGIVGTGKAVRIFTGAPLPDGADTIAIQENVVSASENRVRVLKAEPTGRYIRKAGLDFRSGDTLLSTGTRMGPTQLALAASMNHPRVSVVRRPKVALIATGDELVMPGKNLKPGQIIASNSFGLAGLLESLGADVLDMGIAGDTSHALTDCTNRALSEGADVIVTMGGASVGDHDLVVPTLSQLGFVFQFSKIAMRPGKPFLFATRNEGNRVICLTGLAGNPVSSMVAAHVFVKPLVQRLSGTAPEALVPQQGILGRDLGENDEREEYMRAALAHDEGGTAIVTPFESQDSSMLANLARADCLLIRPKHAPRARSGDPCHFVLF